MTLDETIRAQCRTVHAEWLALPAYKPDINAAVDEMEFVAKYVQTFFRLPTFAEHDVVVRHCPRGWSIFDLQVD